MDAIELIGKPLRNFELYSLDGQPYRLEEGRGAILILNFWSAECSWSERCDRELLALLSAWGGRVRCWWIASNANETAELLRQTANERGIPLVLHDPTQEAADLLGAQTTPHLFILDKDGVVRYRGAPDDITFRQRTAKRHYLREAVEALLTGQAPDPAKTDAYGCMIVRSS